MSTDGFINPVIMVPCLSHGVPLPDKIYKMEGHNDTIMSNYLQTVKYGSYIYSVIMSMMVAYDATIMGGWVRDTLSKFIPLDIDMYVRCSCKMYRVILICFVKRLLERLFTHIFGFDESVIVTPKKHVNQFYYGGVKYTVNVGNETVIMIDLNIFGFDFGKCEHFNPYNNIDFVQNCLTFVYDKQSKNIVLATSRKLKEFGPLIQAYITKQPVLDIVLMMIGFAHIKIFIGPAINMIKSFLGEEWQLIYGSLFTLWKSKELFACHMQCDHTANGDTRLAQTIKSRCNKFEKRNYKLCNTQFCGKSCCFDQSRISDNLTTETNTPYHLDTHIKPMPSVATVQVPVHYNNTSTPEQKPMQLIPCNKGRPHAMRKCNEKKVKRSKVQHLTEAQKNALGMPDMTNRQLESMLNISMPKKTPKSSKRWTYLCPNAKTEKNCKSAPKYSKKYAKSWMQDERGEF